MNTSAAPLLVTMIAAIVMMALSVHAVESGDPAYGSSVLTGADPVLAFAVE